MKTKTTSRWFTALLALVMVWMICPVKTFAVEEGAGAAGIPDGAGTVEAPYQIGTAEELRWFADKVNSVPKATSTLCAELTADINLGGEEWTPIGYRDDYNTYVYYAGTFDGCGRTVSGLNIQSSKQYRAMFGYVKGATIKNLTVKGTVEVSPASSSYAAGIVGYGSPVVLENCTNEVNVTSATKGYVGGIAAATYTGSSITGCVNNGAVMGYGDYVGGIAGTATGGTEIRNCFNNGNIENTGVPSSSAHSTGGIAGGISSASSATAVVSMCVNTGEVASTLKRTGGIVGSLGGTVERCFNTAKVTGTYGVGGIAGDSSDKASQVVACYNTGTVKGITPNVSFNDINAKGVGGIIGGVSSNTNKVSLDNCYNAGSVVLDTTLSDVLSGAVIGDSSGKNYSGVETAGLGTAENCYYLDSAARQGDGRNADASGITAKTDAEMSVPGFAALLGEDYIDNTDGKYPLLAWQNPNAKYAVHFVLEPSGAVLCVTDAEGKEVAPESGTSYLLENGVYSYTVSGDECVEAAGSFTVAYGGQTISVGLKVKTYDFVFHLTPEDAGLEVEGQTPLADGRTYRFSKAGNPYAYTVRAYGYDTLSGTVQVTGDREKDSCDLSMVKKPLYTVSVPYTKEEGGADGEVTVRVASTDYPDAEISANEDGTFSLPEGQYTYSVSCAGYKSVKGEFAVEGAALTLPQANLEIQTAWDGETVTEPVQNSEGVYQITGPDELMWFMKNAPLTASAELTADIRINEEVSENAAAPFVWSPIGASSSKAYTGEFNGNGHSISGIYVDGKTSSNGGLFGYVGTGGLVHHLTLFDSVITGNGNYYGGIVGDLKGTVSNCHVEDTVSVTGKAYVGGIVGELDTGGTVSASSNAGKIKDTGTSGYVGGIAGRVYSAASNALTDCVNTGNVSGYNYAGGITGSIYMGGTLSNVYSVGNVTATNSASGAAGGLVGGLRFGTIQNAYAAGSVSAARQGGVIGYMENANSTKTLNRVYCLSGMAEETVGYENGCSIQGAAQKCTSDELKNIADALGDKFFENDSEINGGYPLLWWQVGENVANPDAPEPDAEGWNGKTASTAPEQENGIYRISTPAELKWFAKAAKATPDIEGVLAADIDLNYRPWTMIGGATAETAFTGALDGNGYTVSNLYLDENSAAGLFGYNAGRITNLNVKGLIHSTDNLAAVAVYNGGTIADVTVEISLIGGNHIAGIAAYNEKGGKISGCRSEGSISGGQYVAGITSSNKGEIENCGNSASVTANGAFAAGVAADNSGGTVANCANSGQIIGKAAVRYAYTGGVIGRNDGTAKALYNRGNVVSLGSCAGGCVAINTSGSKAEGLYNVGDVCGSYIDTEDGEDFRVGGAIGEVVNGVSGAYTLETLTIQCGGTLASLQEITEKAGSLAGVLPEKSVIDGSVSLGDLQAGDEVKAEYAGNAENPVFVWYSFDGVDETVLSVSDTYVVPTNMAGRVLCVKAMEPSLQGIVSGQSGKIDGFTGSVQISGYAVVGHTLTAEYKGEETNPVYQWYRGSAAIEGADKASYTVTESDRGRMLSVRVTGKKPGYVERKAGTAQTEAEAGIWPDEQTDEPVNIAGTYVITTEAELKWFVNQVNGGTPYLNAKLAEEIELTAGNWYPIGSSKYPYTGTFDGNKKAVTSFRLTASSGEQGFFGNIGGKGEVKGLSVSGTVIGDTDDAVSVGGIVGYIDGKVTNCSFTGTVSGAGDVGGIVGQAGLNSKVSQCINRSTVQGKENTGGIAGSVSYGNISECVNVGLVGSENVTVSAGGIAGLMTNYAVINACWNKGGISGKSKLGGIAGDASVCAAPQGCYNIGTVGPGLYAYGVLGGLSGTDYISGTKGSFYLAESEAEATDKTAQGLSSASMKKEGFVTLLNAQAGKDFFVLDSKENDGYPLLAWQIGESGEGDTPENPDEPEILTVVFTLCGDAPHGVNVSHTAYTEWIEPTTCTLPNGATAYDLFKKMMGDYGFAFEANAYSYVSSITGPDNVKLEELANGAFSGWMYTINDEFPDYMDAVKLKDGDEMRFFYTDDYRETSWNPDDSMVEAVMELIKEIPVPVTLESAEKIETARDAYDMLNEFQKRSVGNYQTLVKAERELAVLKADETDVAAAAGAEELISGISLPVTLESRPAILAARAAYDELTAEQKMLVSNYEELVAAENALAALTASHTETAAIEKATADYRVSLGVPQVGSVGGEWMVLGLARSGREIPAGYAGNVMEYVKENIDAKGRLHPVKSTENSRIILALTAAGYDVTDVGGYNLLNGLSDLDYVNGQGINGAIWALIALDCQGYEIPAVTGGGVQTTREMLIQKILDAQLEGGGWSLTESTPETDITAMAVQALAPYYNRNMAAKKAVDDALICLSALQLSDGSYSNGQSSCAESCAQVIVALTALKLDADADTRFMKNGQSVLKALCSFYAEGGGFKHTADGARSGMATEQGFYALTAYRRFLDKKTPLYEMTDVTAGKSVQEAWMQNHKHVWDAGTVTTPATYNAAGVMTYTCTACGTQKKDSIARLTVERVRQLKVTAKGVTEMTLSWSKVKDAQSYTIQQKTKGGKWKKAKVIIAGENAAVTGTKAIVTNLKANTAYSFRVRANVDGRSGEYCTIAKFQKTKAAKKLKKPAAIRKKDLKVKASGANQLTVSWKHIKDASGYIVKWSADGKKWKSKTIPATGTGYTLKKLKAGKTYSVKIAAKNKKGVSRYTTVKAKTKRK
ncbi:MAG: fibronectin type III domain-containing protein [Bacteroidales bacterium]|nr:fibronectin type III domain-containing protein [Clostridium sp.]MCM1204017.1 fibronectin type III domain-containing protein [Bacteroidales bacterium]